MTESDKAWPLVQDAILAFGAKVPDLAKARAALAVVISKGAWRAYAPPIGRPCAYVDFSEWVEASPPRGLETTVDNLQDLARGDTILCAALEEVLKRPHGGDHTSTESKNNNIQLAPQGTSRSRALRKLRTEAEKGNEQAAELHAEVIGGRLSAHAAMVKAGFRPQTISVPISRPERVAAYLRKHMPREAFLRLVELLTKED